MRSRCLFALLAPLALAGACSRDIRLGGEVDAGTADAAPDAATSPFAAGSYVVTFLDPPQQSCTGTLAGHEADFAGITRASSRLVDGVVDLAPSATQLVISGSPIQSGFPSPAITVVPDAGAQPPTLWDSSATGSFGSGPDATTITWLGFAVDSATAHEAGGIQGAYAQMFETSDTSGQCAISFGAQLVRR
jgi:hypothetical protein